MIYDRSGDLKKAAAFYRQALATSLPDLRQKVLNNLAVSLEKQGQRREALQLLMSWEEQSDIQLLNNLGIVQKRSGQIKEARETLEWALKNEPNSFFPNYNMAVCLATEGNSEDQKSSDGKALEFF